MTSVMHRERIISPPRYRRKTVGMVYSPHNSQSVPNSARHSTPRPSSALDRKWVHRSQGDLTLDMDLQAHPRLQSEFYQELYQKYPHAFRRRLEAREAGRKLFNSRLHVRFQDDADASDENSMSHGNLGSLHSNTHLTNWDREVGHYMKHKSRSRECVTSVEPSECSGSVLSVTQRLKLNSHSLNKLLNDDSPFRKHSNRDYVQYDSGTENEQSLQDYMLEKSKERSRHRKQQRRIIIQRKIRKSESVDADINKENETNSRRWISKSVSPTRRHLLKYSLPYTNAKHETHHVNVESLMADSDLKIDTLLEKISAKMSGPESPPDSAIDVDTPSVQSLVASDPKRVDSVKHDTDLPVLNGEQTGSFESPNEDIESSPGSSASAYNSKNSAKIYSDDIMQTKVSSDTLHSCANAENTDSLNVDVHQTQDNCKDGISEEDEINRIVEKYASSENLNQNTGAGLLQLYTAEMGYDNFGSKESADETIKNVDTPSDPSDRNDMDDVDTKDAIERNDSNKCPTSSQTDIPESTAVTTEENKDSKPGIDNYNDIPEVKGDIKQDIDDVIEVPKSPELVEHAEHADYQADDEHEADVVLEEVVQSNSAMSKRNSTHRESDVDSGIGYSSTGTDTLPPQGRATQRETTMKHQPLKADHNLLPLRSEIDVDILDEVNLVHLSHDLQRGRRGNSVRDERDDTDVRLGISKASEKDKRIAEKYRRARSPSPYILRNQLQPTGFRPKSAPSFVQSEMDLRVVDIPYSENLTGKTSGFKQTVVKGKTSYAKHKSNTNSNHTSKTNSCQNADIVSNYSSLPNLTVNQSKHSKIHSSKNASSKLVKQRKCSASSVSSKDSSISLLSESEIDAKTNICNVSYDGAIEDFETVPEGALEEDYAREIDEERFSEIDLDSGTNIENLAENKPSELVRMLKGLNNPAGASPRVKEKRLKIRNILKQRKGSFSPPEETKKTQDEKNIVNRIYAKFRVSTGGCENVEKKSDEGASTSVGVSDPDLDKDTTKPKTSFLKNGIENIVMRTTPYKSAMSIDKDTESVDKFISGASSNTVKAKPVILKTGSKECESVKTKMPDGSGDENETIKNSMVNVEAEIAISPTKAQPPKKPVRNKNKNKNLNVLADQLNFSKYKIKVEDGQSPYENAILQSTEKEMERSDQNTESHKSPLQKTTESTSNPKANQLSLGRGASADSELEVWQPLKSNIETNENTSGKKRGSKGKFNFFKKALSMDRGIETVGMDPNPTGQSSQGSKGNHSNGPKVKKAPSLKSFTSLFSRKKKKKGQFIIQNAENPGKKGSLNRSEQTFELTNGKQQHYASCHSLETVDTPSHHQPIRKHSRGTISSQQEIHPVGKLLRMNPDGTHVIQLYKPENGPIGFFIANGSAKYENGIFVSRFAETRPEHCFAGLLGIGDEIIEVNGHPVRDLSQDAVYQLISASAVVLVKVFPFVARKDV